MAINNFFTRIAEKILKDKAYEKGGETNESTKENEVPKTPEKQDETREGVEDILHDDTIDVSLLDSIDTANEGLTPLISGESSVFSEISYFGDRDMIDHGLLLAKSPPIHMYGEEIENWKKDTLDTFQDGINSIEMFTYTLAQNQIQQLAISLKEEIAKNRQLTLQEKEVFSFFKNLSSFLQNFQKNIQKIREIDFFGKLENSGSMLKNRQNENYARENYNSVKYLISDVQEIQKYYKSLKRIAKMNS
ncbi:hypothetical protein CSB09_00325 [Candidatus Gracilibacteria bacterium]|nr:MAG: hypothetical protein CSB09_00325 [Candidatus Gracilibacteria bacterium]